MTFNCNVLRLIFLNNPVKKNNFNNFGMKKLDIGKNKRVHFIYMLPPWELQKVIFSTTVNSNFV